MFVARKGFIHKNGAALVDFIKPGAKTLHAEVPR
jgi:hypothetical protein